MTMLDRRLNAYRPDLADERLSGKVEAARFTAGTPMRVSASVLDLRAEPRMDSGPQTQIIFGDPVRVFEEMDGWSWVQAERDGYTGYVSASALQRPAGEATHLIVVPRTFIYPGPDLRFPHTMALSLGSRVRVVGAAETRGTKYALLENGEALIASHLSPLGEHASDYVSVAETLLHTPICGAARLASASTAPGWSSLPCGWLDVRCCAIPTCSRTRLAKSSSRMPVIRT